MSPAPSLPASGERPAGQACGPERLALAGFLAGYRGLTREAYALDLRQFAAWCRSRSLSLFAVRRADIEGFARELEARGRARATVTQRLCTIAGFPISTPSKRNSWSTHPPRTSAGSAWQFGLPPENGPGQFFVL